LFIHVNRIKETPGMCGEMQQDAYRFFANEYSTKRKWKRGTMFIDLGDADSVKKQDVMGKEGSACKYGYMERTHEFFTNHPEHKIRYAKVLDSIEFYDPLKQFVLFVCRGELDWICEIVTPPHHNDDDNDDSGSSSDDDNNICCS
jgi:hypothetical protein